MRSKLRYICLLSLLSCHLTGSPCHADKSVPVASGTALAELGETPPAPPVGFATSDEAFKAVRTGKVPAVNLFEPLPPNIVVQRDIEYGNSGNRPLLLDLYSPKGAETAVPGVIFVHGGSWKHGKKEDYRVYAIHFARLGYVVASVQYRLSKEAPFPAAIHDVKAAVRYMRAEADSIGVDPDRIALAGGSAGGHLSMMVAYSADVPELDGDSGHSGVSSQVQCVVNLYGPTDMTTEYVQNISTTNTAVSDFFEGTYEQQPDSYAAGSPLKYVTSDDPPTLILHGTVDTLVPINQADLLATKLAEVGVPYIYDRLPGWPHSMDVAKPVNERCRWYMERLFQRYLRLAKTSE
ncbi:MAG: alpha/beta hydrolase [Planctomycetaceae bacterium]